MPDPRSNPDGPSGLSRALSPRTIAVVGDKRANGYLWLRNMSTFQGKVYSVQVDPNEIPGIEELDLNPVFAYPKGALAVDARIVVTERTS